MKEIDWQSILSIAGKGILGSLAFAVLVSVTIPWVTSFQANSGILVSEPRPEVAVRGTAGDVNQGETANYTLFIRNSGKRLAEEVRFSFYFRGCAVNRGFWSKAGRNWSNPGITFNSFKCVETVYIPNLAKGEEVRLKYTVEHNISKAILSTAALGTEADFAYSVEYQWQLNGMTFSECRKKRVKAPFSGRYAEGSSKIPCNRVFSKN